MRATVWKIPVVVTFVLAAVSINTAGAATHPIILSYHVSRRSVPDSGGTVAFTVRVRNINECRLVVAGHRAVAVTVAGAWQRCANGVFRKSVTFGTNSTQTAQEIAIRVYLRRGTEIYWYPLGSVRVNASTPPPKTPRAPTASLTISASTISSAGGSVTLTFSSTQASTCLLSANPTLWFGSNPATVSCNGTYRATIGSTSVKQQWTFTFTATNTGGQSATSTQTLEQVPPAPSFGQSSDWSGYIVPSSSALITDVSGHWTVPTLNCADTPNAGASTWVGTGGGKSLIGGSSGDLLQTGIRDNCLDGVQRDVGWWEEAPERPESDFSDFRVSPGDSIEAFVFQISGDCTTNCGQWETQLEDLTTGLAGYMVTGQGWGVASISSSMFPYQGITTYLTYSGATTAEWIVEDYLSPELSLAPFANYGTVSFSNLHLGGLSPWHLTTSEGEELVQYGFVLSTPSAPGNDGFSVSYTGP